MKKIIAVVLFGMSLSAFADFSVQQSQEINSNSNVNIKELYCPDGQTMKGLHEQCINTGCVVDYLHCS